MRHRARDARLGAVRSCPLFRAEPFSGGPMARPWLWLSSSALWLATQVVNAQPPASASADVELERMLATDARLAWIEQVALARHPALRESRERVRAGAER